ncbi:MAG: putative viral replication protein [Circoviridae sp.]|nr:MAG: putative viral replication protein [Circoviridae sp.]
MLATEQNDLLAIAFGFAPEPKPEPPAVRPPPRECRTAETTTKEDEGSPQKRYRNVCFTWNNPPEGAIDQIKALDYVSFAVIGKEVGKSGTPHLQGYLEFFGQKTHGVLHEDLERSHFEPRRGTAEQAASYCRKGQQSKEENQHSHEAGPNYGLDADVTEWGRMGVGGERTDLHMAHESIQSKRSWRHVLNSPELVPTTAKYLAWSKEVFKHRPLRPMDEPEEWRPWQKKLLDEVTQPCTDTRRITWVYDPGCGAGKTTLAKFLVRNHEAAILSGKRADIAHAYADDPAPIAIFDFPKDVADADGRQYICYGAIEEVKDGLFHSPKYEGKTCCRDFEAHVIVFANCLPKPGCWDPKRTHLIDLSPPADPPAEPLAAATFECDSFALALGLEVPEAFRLDVSFDDENSPEHKKTTASTLGGVNQHAYAKHNEEAPSSSSQVPAVSRTRGSAGPPARTGHHGTALT